MSVRTVCQTGRIVLQVRLIFHYICSMLAQGYHHIRVHTPGATESATVRNDFCCMICGSQLKEDVKFRVLGGVWLSMISYLGIVMFCM